MKKLIKIISLSFLSYPVFADTIDLGLDTVSTDIQGTLTAALPDAVGLMAVIFGAVLVIRFFKRVAGGR